PELPALLDQAAQAGAGLRVLPQLLRGIATRKANDLALAEASARRSGQVWAQISALTWTAALNPTTRVVRWLSALLEATGWRRPSLVPADIAADAALGMASAGLTNQLIAERLSLSPHTIARHLANARAKLGAANRAEAAAKLEEMQV